MRIALRSLLFACPRGPAFGWHAALLRVALTAPIAGCGSEEALAPARVCATPPPSSGWPSEDGILNLDVAPPTGTFTMAPHRAMPTVDVPQPVVMTQPKLVTVLASGDPLAEVLFGFSDAVPGSAWWPAVSGEYGVGQLRAGPHLVGAPMASTMTDADLIAYVEDAIAGASSDAAPDGQTLYLVYLAPGTDYVDGNDIENCGCAELAGGHISFGGGNTLALVQRCSKSDINLLTVVASHEIVEATTDPTGRGFVVPAPSPPWSGLAIRGNELGDLCGGTRYHEGDYEYQRSYSNAAAALGDDACVPALGEPFYNVSVASDWIAVAAGATVSVDVVGWATGPRDDWFVYPGLRAPKGFAVSVTSGESASADGIYFYGVNNGKTMTLQVTAPSDAPSGTYATVQLVSRPSSAGSDSDHYIECGVYVP